jgi:hypothetical protein
MFGLQRESRRYSHGHHLAPQDANSERTRRRRHKGSADDKERRHHSAERGYRSDHEPRRRHRDDGDGDRVRANSSHRPQDVVHHTDDSSSDTEDHPVRRKSVSMQKTYGDHFFRSAEKSGRLPERHRSNTATYGDHRHDDSFEERRIPLPLAPTTSSFTPPSLARDVSDQFRRGHHLVRIREPQEPALRHSEKAIYGDHYEGYLVHEAASLPVRKQEQSSREQPYGEHRFENEQVTKAPSTTSSSRDGRHAVNFPSLPLPSATRPLSRVTSEQETGTTQLGDRSDFTRQTNEPPASTQRVHNISPSSNHRDSAWTFEDRSPDGDLDRRPSTSDSKAALVANAKLPRLSVSHYPLDLSQSLSNIVVPDDSRSEANDDTQRVRSGSGASTTCSGLLSRTPSLSGSGVLGPRTYQYQPLQMSEIRLVKVLPERMWKLKCEILHVSLDNVPEYTAISVSYHNSFMGCANA